MADTSCHELRAADLAVIGPYFICLLRWWFKGMPKRDRVRQWHENYLRSTSDTSGAEATVLPAPGEATVLPRPTVHLDELRVVVTLLDFPLPEATKIAQVSTRLHRLSGDIIRHMATKHKAYFTHYIRCARTAYTALRLAGRSKVPQEFLKPLQLLNHALDTVLNPEGRNASAGSVRTLRSGCGSVPKRVVRELLRLFFDHQQEVLIVDPMLISSHRKRELFLEILGPLLHYKGYQIVRMSNQYVADRRWTPLQMKVSVRVRVRVWVW